MVTEVNPLWAKRWNAAATMRALVFRSLQGNVVVELTFNILSWYSTRVNGGASSEAPDPAQHAHRSCRRPFMSQPTLSSLMWLRSLGGGVFAALRGGLVAAITQDWLQVGVAV
jgi:hypothetical protein